MVRSGVNIEIENQIKEEKRIFYAKQLLLRPIIYLSDLIFETNSMKINKYR